MAARSAVCASCAVRPALQLFSRGSAPKILGGYLGTPPCRAGRQRLCPGRDANKIVVVNMVPIGQRRKNSSNHNCVPTDQLSPKGWDLTRCWDACTQLYQFSQKSWDLTRCWDAAKQRRVFATHHHHLLLYECMHSARVFFLSPMPGGAFGKKYPGNLLSAG